jgi:hypothetical protein
MAGWTALAGTGRSAVLRPEEKDLRLFLRYRTSFALIMLAMISSTQATPAVPQPFIATYHVSFRGIGAGTLRMEWRRDSGSDRYVFETRANPSALAKLVVSDSAFERTTLELTPDGLRPLSWEADGGRSGEKGNGKLVFDWNANTVTGTDEGNPVKLALEPGIQDRLSIQIGVMMSLINGEEPGTIAMINGDSVRRYTYTRGKSETIRSPEMGPLETIVYESTRPNSNRLSRVWHVPSLEYLPARAEQVRKGKIETVMTLIEIEKQ